MYNRLFLLNVDNYRDRVKYRWSEILDSIDLIDLYEYLDTNKADLINSNAIVRNNQNWGMSVDLESEIESLKSWLDTRIIFFNNYINENY